MADVIPRRTNYNPAMSAETNDSGREVRPLIVDPVTGRLLVSDSNYTLTDIVSGNASNTDGASTACIAAGATGVVHYLTDILLSNTSGSAIYVEIKDGTTTKLTIPVPANGGATINLATPVPGTAATAWNFDPSAATTTVYCSMVGFAV